MRILIPCLTLALLGTASAATCTVASTQKALKGPVSTTYRIETKDLAVGGQTIKGKTTVQTTTIKSVPGGIQMTMTENEKTTTVKSTCVGGKAVIEINGKAMSSELTNLPAGSNVDLKDSFIDFKKHKVGDTWSGTLSSVKTEGVTSETKFTNKILGTEKVTTPAGNFDTYKVQQQISIKMTMSNMPKSVKMPNMDTKTISTTWYDKKNPSLIVKSVSDHMTMTLLKYAN